MQYFFDQDITQATRLAKRSDFMRAATLLMEHEHRITYPSDKSDTFEELVGTVLRLMDNVGTTELALKENSRRSSEHKEPLHEILSSCTENIEHYEDIIDNAKDLHLQYHLEKA